jgi:hypothetical protein
MENEAIFLGGGKFYKNKELDEEGFLDLGNANKHNKQMFECWYSLESKPERILESKPTNTNTIERILNIIDPVEYEFITSVNDINHVLPREMSLTAEEKQQLFDEIQKRQTGGKKIKKNNKKNNKKNKTRKNKTRKNKTRKNKTRKNKTRQQKSRIK